MAIPVVISQREREKQHLLDIDIVADIDSDLSSYGKIKRFDHD